MDKYEAVKEKLISDGKSQHTASAVVSTVSSLECRLVPPDWESASDETLQKIVTDDKVVRYRLRLVLSLLFPDAATRWPSLFCRTRRSLISLSEESALPAKVYKMPRESPVRQMCGRLYSEFVSTSQAKSPSPMSVRNNITFVYNFLFGDPLHSLVPIGSVRDDPDALVAFLLECSPADVTKAYATYRAESPLLKRQTTLANLCTHIRLLNFVFKRVLRARGWSSKSLSTASFGISTVGGGRKRLHAELDDAATSVSSVSRFSLRFVEVNGPGPGWIKHDERGATTTAQHHFTADEVRRLYMSCETLFEKLMCTALLTTGMRRKGFARAEARSVLTRTSDGWKVGAKWWTTEKRGYRVSYDISPALGRLIREWAESGQAGSVFLVPSHRSQQLPVSGSHIFRTFANIAKRAGVVGRHVHPHTTRHTVAWTLSALGNNIEDIARFVHHKSAQVTNAVYVNMSREQCVSRMTCPWLVGSNNEGASLEETAWDLAEALASPFLSDDGRTFPSLKPVSNKCARRERNNLINTEMKEMMAMIKKLT